MDELRPLDSVADRYDLVRLWHRSFAGRWPLNVVDLLKVLESAAARDATLVALAGGRLIGLAAAGIRADEGQLQVLVVDPAARRRGVATLLHAEALSRLRAAGCTRARVGNALWPGIPATARGALAFFANCGWRLGQETFDLVGRLRDVPRHPALPGDVEIVTAVTPGAVRDLLDFQQRVFPRWADDYRRTAEAGDLEDIVLARDASGEVLGAVLVHGPGSSRWENKRVWQKILGEDMCVIGEVGVSPKSRRRGIGLALVAQASRWLSRRGGDSCLIHWTGLVSWYGRLGYEIWAEYRLAELKL
ncbi:MAG: GNAT family N-acetyltransferase [Nitriliruptorales bacterium]